MDDTATLREQISRCRRLADGVDGNARQVLLEMAQNYEERLRSLTAEAPDHPPVSRPILE